MKFFLWQNGETGPFDLATIESSLRSGEFSPKMLARPAAGTSKNWQPLEVLLSAHAGPQTHSTASPAPAKATNKGGRQLAYGLSIVGLVVLLFGFSRFSVSDDSVEGVTRTVAANSASRAFEAEASAKGAAMRGDSDAARELYEESKESRAAAKSGSSEADAMKSSREGSARLLVGAGILFLVVGMILRVFV
jgi:hypothetical protein